MRNLLPRTAAPTLVACAACLLASSHAALAQQTRPADRFFSYDVNAAAAVPDLFNATPRLGNDNAEAVSAELTAARGQGKVLAVKVVEPLTDPASLGVFNQFALRYVFADFLGDDNVARTRALADRVVSSPASVGAFVGNFNFYPNAGNDPT